MSIIFEQFPDNPGNNVDVTNLLNSIRDLYSSTKSDKYQTISTLRKLSKLDTAESRKLNDVNRFKDKSDMIKSNLESYVSAYKGDIESFITTLDKNGVAHSSLLNRYRSHIDYLRDNGKISNKNYNEAQLYFNFINDYITYMEGKKVELKDGRFADLNERYNGNEQVVNDWMDKIGNLYTTLVGVVSLHKTRKDELRNIQKDNLYYVVNSSGLLERYNTVIANYNSMVSDLNNLIGNGPELLESEIVVINAEIDALQTEINSIQSEIDGYDAQLAPLYVERDGYQAEKLAIYNQWLAAKAAILEPITEKQNQISGLNNDMDVLNNFQSIYDLRYLCELRDGRELFPNEVTELNSATSSLTAATANIQAYESASAIIQSQIAEYNTLRDLTLAIPNGRSLTPAEEELVVQYTISIESPSTPEADIPGLIQARQLILDIVGGRPLTDDSTYSTLPPLDPTWVSNTNASAGQTIVQFGDGKVSELSFVGIGSLQTQGGFNESWAYILVAIKNDELTILSASLNPTESQNIVTSSTGVINYYDIIQNGRPLTAAEQIEYSEKLPLVETFFGITFEVVNVAAIQYESTSRWNTYQSQIDALNVEIADLQAIVTQYTLNDELDRLPNENGDVYMDLMDIPSNLFDAIYVEITGIEELRAPLLVTKDEKISQVDSKNSLIVTKQALIDDIENSEANLIKVTDALTVVTTDKTALDVEMAEYQTKYNESETYYNDILSDLVVNHSQIMGSINSVKNEMDDTMFQQIKNMNKTAWIQWKISDVFYSQGYLDSSTFNIMNLFKDWDYNSNIARDNFDTINDSIFVKNSQESDLYFGLASSASSLYGGLNSTEFQTNLVIAKNQEYDLRIQLADQLNYNTEKGASVNLTINEIGTLLTQFVNINPITDDFNSVYGYVMSELTNKYNTLDSYRNEFYLGERSSQHLLYRVERHVGLCEGLKSQMESIFVDLDSKLIDYRTNRTGLINQLPGNSGSDVLGDWSKLSSLEMHGGQYTSSWIGVRANSAIYYTKLNDTEYRFRSIETGEYLEIY